MSLFSETEHVWENNKKEEKEGETPKEIIVNSGKCAKILA